MAKWQDYLRQAFRAKDSAELEEVEKQASSDPEMAGGGGDSRHTHIHIGGHGGARDDDPPGGGAGGAGGGGGSVEELAERMAAMERQHQEMQAEQEETNSMLDELLDAGEGESGEEDRRRIMDRIRDRRERDRRGGGRHAADRERDRRERDAARDAYRDYRRAHDEDPDKESEEWKRDNEELETMDSELRRSDCSMDRARRHRDRIRDMKRARDARHRDAEGNREILKEIEFEAPPGTGDKARKARDSAALAMSWQDTVSLAEIIAPGQSFRTFDSAAQPVATVQAIDTVRARTLDLAYGTAAMRGVIDDTLGRPYGDGKALSIGERRTLFRAVGAMARQRNNGGHAGGGAAVRVHDTNTRTGVGPTSIADLQKLNSEFWAKQAQH